VLASDRFSLNYHIFRKFREYSPSFRNSNNRKALDILEPWPGFEDPVVEPPVVVVVVVVVIVVVVALAVVDELEDTEILFSTGRRKEIGWVLSLTHPPHSPTHSQSLAVHARGGVCVGVTRRYARIELERPVKF
jgi:hypothetical protein